MEVTTENTVPDTSTPIIDTDLETTPSPEEDTEMADAGSKCTCPSCTGMAQPQQPEKKPRKKRYSPPQPDANTFRTQQEFLGSIEAIPIDSVDENSRKCPICWKPFGEAADPGFDNTEEPVKLRCDHVFGDKCLRQTFALPGTSTVDIRPITFLPKSRGTALGQKLCTYAENHREKPQDDILIFSKMLEESYLPEKGSQIFGDYWWPVIRQLQSGTHDLGGVTLLDNAVILDKKPPKTREQQNKGKKLVKTPGGYEVYLPSVAVPETSGNDSPFAFPDLSTEAVQVPATLNTLDSIGYSTTFSPSWAQQQMSSASFLPLPPMESLIQAPLLSSTTELSTVPNTVVASPDPAPAPASQPSSTWEEALAEKQTQLDKLIAKKDQLTAKLATKLQGSPIEETELGKQHLAAQNMALQKAVESKKLAEMHKQAREAQERMKQDSIRLVAIELARIYAVYMAEFEKPKEKEQKQEQNDGNTPPDQPRFLPTSVTVHKKDLKSTSYNIRSLDQYLPMIFYGGGDDSDDEADDDGDGQQSMLNKVILIITRSLCTSSCCRFSDKEAAKLNSPTSLWWKNDRKVPDDCPICHKVLFHKQGQSSRRPQPVNIETDEESEDGSIQ